VPFVVEILTRSLTMRDRIQEALKRSKADYTEIRIEEKETTRVVFRGKDLETANANIDKGGIVRCLIRDKGWGVTTFNNLDDLVNKVDQAYQCAQVGSVPEPIELVPVEPVVKTMTVEMKRDFRDISLAEKKALAERYNQVVLGHSDKIIDSQAGYADTFSRLILANSEGTPARRNWLIRDGELVGRLHSRQTAAKMGESASGNARAINYRFPPIVRMTNTAIDNGTASFEDMIKDIELGIYACDAYGGQTQLENFSFSSGYAYMIRKGKIAEMVKDVILAGNLFTTLENIDAIGNDFKWLNTGGGCGKGNQFPLPVGMGAPHIRIQNVVIGGE
jgi:predicted Zn-dependent protease